MSRPIIHYVIANNKICKHVQDIQVFCSYDINSNHFVIVTKIDGGYVKIVVSEVDKE